MMSFPTRKPRHCQLQDQRLPGPNSHVNPKLGHVLERSIDAGLQLVRSSPLPSFQGVDLGDLTREHLLPRALNPKP